MAPNKGTLKKTLSWKQVRKKHLSVGAVNAWNSLPEFLVDSETTISFKDQLDKVLKQKMFEIDEHASSICLVQASESLGQKSGCFIHFMGLRNFVL